MAAIQHASYQDWWQAYGDTYEALPNPPTLACPNCAHHTLRLEFIANESDRIGYAKFWCETCLFGIHISRTWVPEGVTFHPIGTPRETPLPDYTLVHPDPTTTTNENTIDVDL